MKKITSTALLGILFFAFASSASAATTAFFTPTQVSVTSGQRFNLTVSVNPQGGADYAEKIEVNYPADLLEVVAFTPAPTWIAMNQSGYDSINNGSGILVKTAGYPAGISSPGVFGTITFYAKKTGNGIVKIGSNSLAFQANAQTAITGTGSAITITAPVFVPVAPAKKPETVKTATTSAVSTASTTSSTFTAASSTQTAALGSATGLSTAVLWVIIVILLIVIAIMAVYIWQKRERE